ncbi:MAG: lysylphosphatidylglycerol synthase transmembrane domain-containing protein [bacterium]
MATLKQLLDWKRLVGLLVALGLLFATFYKINFEELWATLERVNLWLLLGAFVSAILMNCAKAMRWGEIMKGAKVIRPMRILALFHLGQMINLSLPVLTGQAGRVVMVAKQEGLSKTFCLTTVVMEVLFDGLSLIVLIYLSSFIFSFPDWVRQAEIYAALGVSALILLLVLILRNQRALAYFGKTKIRRRFPKFYCKLQQIAKSVTDGLHTLRSMKQILKVSAYSVLVWICHVGVACTLIMAFKLDVPVWAGVVVIIVNSILLLVPISPGNIGSFQLAVFGALAMFSVSKSEAVAFSLVLHLMDLAPVFLVGIGFLFTNQLTFSRLREEAVAAVDDVDCPERIQS